MIPSLCPEPPKPQREALKEQVRAPILYTNVALRNWQAWKKLGIGAVVSPGGYNDLEDPWYEDWNDERYPHVRARKPFGRITIANSDAGADAMMEVAVEQGHRAVSELL